MILADFRCPVHGVFEQIADRDADEVPCPVIEQDNMVTTAVDADAGTIEVADLFSQGRPCGLPSPWSPSAVFGRMQEVTATRGKSDPKPHPMAMDTMELGEGRSYNDWKKERRKRWREHDYKRRKDEGRIP